MKKSSIARGYMKKNGEPLTVKELQDLFDRYKKKWAVRFKIFFCIWSDFDRRRKFDKYLLKKGYRISRQKV